MLVIVFELSLFEMSHQKILHLTADKQIKQLFIVPVKALNYFPSKE